MPRFVARPITVSAEQFKGTISQWPESFRLAVIRHVPGGTTEVMTGDGVRPLRFSDWLVHSRGVFTVWHEAAFEASFEERAEPKAMATDADSSSDKAKAGILRGVDRKGRPFVSHQ